MCVSRRGRPIVSVVNDFRSYGGAIFS